MAQDPGLSFDRIVAEARQIGFDLVGIIPAGPPSTAGHYRTWLDEGYHGEMAYLARPDSVAKREDLSCLLPGVRSVVVVGTNYFAQSMPPEQRDDPSRGVIASYAWSHDYHDFLLSRLHQLADFIEAATGRPAGYRAYVDTGPILERDLAARAGLGFIGKNTNLIHPSFGSWLLLGEILLAIDLPADSYPSHARQTRARLGSNRDLASLDVHTAQTQSLDFQLLEIGTCGRCTRCLDACPTGALVEPYVLDARRCISYLTIEMKGPMPREFRTLVGNCIFGCDICQEVCPWNRRFSQATSDPAFRPRPDGFAPLLLDLITMDDAEFRQRFRASPVRRAKRRGLLRNVSVALGNWGDPTAIPALARVLNDPEPLVRGHAAWALGCMGTAEARRALEQASRDEPDAWVLDELGRALNR